MINATSFSFDALDRLCGNKSMADAPCPACGPSCKSPANQRRKVLRIWHDDDFITYKCARCEAAGYARASGSTAGRGSKPRPAQNAEPVRDKAELARYLWSKSLPLVGSLAETYLRSRQCFIECGNLRFLPARGEHHAAMIARFGAGEVTSVHLTKLRADGSGKAGTENDKIIIGPSVGQPIILLDNEDHEELAVAEGIEDTASLAVATGWSSWAAATANRIAPVVTMAPKASRLYLASDLDWGKPDRIRAGPRALRKAVDIRPDLIPLHFEKALGIGVDANKALIRFGPDVVLAVVEAGEASARFAQGQTCFEAMMRESRRAQEVFTTLSEIEGDSRGR